MNGLSVQTRTEGEAVVVALVGAADVAGAALLERELTMLSARRPARVVFDLSGVTFISSLCIGALVSFYRGSAAWKGRVALAGANETVAGALRRCRLDHLFSMPPNANLNDVATDS